MNIACPVIARGMLRRGALAGKTVLVTGGGGGIGLEAARSLVWLGARVCIVEVDAAKGTAAEHAVNEEFGAGSAAFFHCDISRAEDVDRLFLFVRDRFGYMDVILNNATITPLGEAHKIGVTNWDRNYGVNLRGPVLLLERFLPGMLARRTGALVFVPSSGAAPYMGAYEVFKTAQVELCNTLVGELEGSGVFAFSIGPGLVKTETALKGIEKVSALMGISAEEFIQGNIRHMLDAESAGAGFAAAIAQAERYNGQEIGSIQALMDIGIALGQEMQTDSAKPVALDEAALNAALLRVQRTFQQQYSGWLARNLFERQWVLRDFKKETGQSAEQMKAALEALMAQGSASAVAAQGALFASLKRYYEHQLKLLQGYEKNPEKLRENSDIIRGWISEVQECLLSDDSIPAD